MACYKFTYKDVLKRYERIINKPSKFEIRLLACILLVITIVNITSLCFAAEDVTLSSYQGLGINVGGAVLSPNSNSYIYYVELEPNYYYTITLNNSFTSLRYGFGNALEDGAEVYNPTFVGNGNDFSFTFNSNQYNYLYFYVNDVVDYTSPSNSIITREPISGLQGAVDGLVENVGISQIWDIFDTSIGFVGVVVLVAFGIFLVVIAIRKMQKGKSEF